MKTVTRKIANYTPKDDGQVSVSTVITQHSTESNWFCLSQFDINDPNFGGDVWIKNEEIPDLIAGLNRCIALKNVGQKH